MEPTGTLSHRHPLAPILPDEVTVVKEALERAGLLSGSALLAYMGLEEPGECVGGGARVARSLRVVVVPGPEAVLVEAVVELQTGRIRSTRQVDDARPALSMEESMRAIAAVQADPRWLDAMARRGVQDIDQVQIDPWPAGTFDGPYEAGRRLCRCLTYVRYDRHDNAYAHPVEGVVAVVDMGRAEVLDVIEDEVLPVPAEPGPENPWGTAFVARATVLRSEAEARRDADASRSRSWRVVSATSRNRLGQPAAYELRPGSTPRLLASAESSVGRRAGFAAHHIWVTAYHPDERRAAGEYPNQSAGGDGLPRYSAADRPLVDANVVLWHTFGVTHLPRPEDWPVMPVAYAGFHLVPVGFFDANPALDLAPSTVCQMPG